MIPPTRNFNDFLSSLPKAPVQDRTTSKKFPTPKELLAGILLAKQRPGDIAGKLIRSAGDAQQEAYRKSIAGDLNATLDAAMDAITPMGIAGSLSHTGGKAFSSVADNPASKDFLETLYSRLEAAIVGGPNKAQGNQWLKHLEKGATKGEIDHTGLIDFLNQNKDRVFTKAEISRFSKVNPVRLKEVDGGGQYRGYFPQAPDGFTPQKGTYKETILTGNLPYSQETLGASDRLKELPALLEDARQASIKSSENFNSALSSGSGVNEAEREFLVYNRKYRELQKEFNKLSRITEQAPAHFDEPNQVGWIRTLLGNRAGKISQLFGEGQADVHQRARTQGRLGKAGETLFLESERLFQRFLKAKQDLENYRKLQGTPEFTTDVDFELTRKLADAEDFYKMYSGDGKGMLPLPFMGDKEWGELLLKRGLFEAAQNNADEMLFPSGQAVHDAIGTPLEAAKKMYEKDFPNQLVEYLRKNLGIQTKAEPVMKAPTGNEVLAPLKYFQRILPGTPTSNKFGPVPRDFDMHGSKILDGLSPQQYNGLPGPAPNNLIETLQNYIPDLSAHHAIPQVSADAAKVDLDLIRQNLPFAGTFSGTSVPIPKEAYSKIMSDGQRLWALLAAAGIPTFLQQQKKNDPKRTKPKGS